MFTRAQVETGVFEPIPNGLEEVRVLPDRRDDGKKRALRGLSQAVSKEDSTNESAGIS